MTRQRTMRFDFSREELVILKEALRAYLPIMLANRQGEYDGYAWTVDCAAMLKTDFAVSLRHPDLE